MTNHQRAERLETIKTTHEASLKAKDEMTEQAHQRNEAVREAIASGIPVAELAAALNVDRQRIYQMSRTVRTEERP